MFYHIIIDATGIGGAAPSDGFIDPSSIESYRARKIYTGTVEGPTVLVGKAFKIGNIDIVTTDATVAQLALDINEKSYQHGVKASVDVNDSLVLRKLPGYEDEVLTVQNIDDGVIESFGFVSPVVTVDAYPATLDLTVTKERANIRWNLVLESLQLSSNIKVRVSDIPSGTPSVAPTRVEFVLEVADNYFNYDFTGNTVYGKLAVQNAIAKTLMYSVVRNRELCGPFVADNNPFGNNIREVTVGPLTTDMQDAIDAVSVSVIPLN